MPRCYYSRSKARRRIGQARSNPRFISQSVTPGLLLQGLLDLSAFAGWKQFVPKAEMANGFDFQLDCLNKSLKCVMRFSVHTN